MYVPIHVAELTIKQTLTLTDIDIHPLYTHTPHIYIYRSNKPVYAVPSLRLLSNSVKTWLYWLYLMFLMALLYWVWGVCVCASVRCVCACERCVCVCVCVSVRCVCVCVWGVCVVCVCERCEVCVCVCVCVCTSLNSVFSTEWPSVGCHCSLRPLCFPQIEELKHLLKLHHLKHTHTHTHTHSSDRPLHVRCINHKTHTHTD